MKSNHRTSTAPNVAVGTVSKQVLDESINLPIVIRRKLHQDGNGKDQHLIQAKLNDLEIELKNTKQSIVKHVLQSRAIEKSKIELLMMHQSLHKVILEKNEPTLYYHLEMRKLANSFAFNNQYPLFVLRKIDALISWKHPDLIQFLIDKISSYSNADFQKTLEESPFTNDVSLDLFIQIALNGSNFMLSIPDIKGLYQKAVEIYQKFKGDSHFTINQSLWEVLKRILYRKLLQLYLIQQAVLFISEAEQKIQHKEHFQYRVSTASGNPTRSKSRHPIDNLHSVSSSLDDVPSILPNKSLLSTSLTSLDSKKSQNKKKNQRHHPKRPMLQPLPLEKELEKSKEFQQKLQEQIVQNFHQIVLQDVAFRKEDSSRSNPPLSSTNNHLYSSTLPSPTSSSSFLPNISPKHSRSVPTPAIKQYYYQLGLTKFFTFMTSRYFLKRLRNSFQQWQKYLSQRESERNIIQVIKQVSYYRLFRVFQYNLIRRSYHRFHIWLTNCQSEKLLEELSAVLTIQRFGRGYIARKLRKKVTTVRAANCINGIMRIFVAKKLARIRRMKVLERKSAHIIETAWYKSRFRLSINQRVLAKRQMKSLQLIQRVFRGYKGRKIAAKRRRHHQMIQGALKFQTLFRRYQASLRVDKLRTQRNRLKASILIQKQFRRHLHTTRFAIVKKRHQKAKVIQYAWWYYKARCVRYEHLKWWKAIEIQRIVRGKLGRKRFQHFVAIRQETIQRRAEAIEVIKPIAVGHITRRRLKDVLQSYLQRRQEASKVLQRRFTAVLLGQKARLRVQTIRALDAEVRLREYKALKIQRQIRQFLAKRRVAKLRQQREIERQREELSKVPYYYRLQKRYFYDQNMYHYHKLVKIQCLARRYLARRKVARRKLERANDAFESLRTFDIQSLSRKGTMDPESMKLSIKMFAAQFAEAERSGKLSEKDRAKLREFRESEVVRAYFIVIVQRYVRGFVTRSTLRRTTMIPVLVWFCRETIVRAKIRQFLINYREYKREQIRRYRATTKIAALVRGRQQRKRYKKNYRLLVRQREIRIRTKRSNAALCIQCAYRCYRAKKRVLRQRRIVEEREKERKELQELEDSIQGLHGRWMHELMAIRAQTGVRGMLARSEFAKRVEAFKKKEEENRKKKRDQSAKTIQALMRGVIARKKFKKNLPTLKKQQKMRMFCVQCEQQIARKRCRQCRDRFCNDCYDLIHQKGNRKNHSWENIKIDARMMALAFDSENAGNTGGMGQRISTFGGSTTRNTSMIQSTTGGRGSVVDRDESPVKEPVKKINPKDWEEFYDEAAKAKYWYNKKTGEASWVNPLK